MGDLPVLTAGAKEVAAQAAHGKPLTPRKEMKKRLDLDGRYSQGGHAAIDGGEKLTAHIPPCPAVAALSGGDGAPALA